MNQVILALLGIALLGLSWIVVSPDGTNQSDLEEQALDPISVIEQYHHGFISDDPSMVTDSLGDNFMMFNGNFSGEPTDWQAHMFLSGQNLVEWPNLFLEQAGPYENEFEVIHQYVRGDSALIVTRDSGSNRFRSWEDEITTWLLGRIDGDWKIVGFYIRDIQNPE